MRILLLWRHSLPSNSGRACGQRKSRIVLRRVRRLTMLDPAAARAFLQEAARCRRLVAYREMASALKVMPPNTIHQVTVALELLMEEDAAANRPLIAALAVSGTLGDLPRRGFFDCASRLGRFAGDPDGPDARTFHAGEADAAFVFWGGADGK